jgi:hypothetical protein
MKKTAFLFALLAALFTACSPTPEAEEATATIRPEVRFTQAAETAIARTTLTAQASPVPEDTLVPTATPLPSGTPTPEPSQTPSPDSGAPTATTGSSGGGTNCDSSVFVSDVTVPDGKLFDPGEDFTKTWQIANNGSCTWTLEYSLRFVEGAQMSAESPQPMIIEVPPGTLVEISVFMMAPQSAGSHTGFWQMQNANGEAFGNRIYVEIEVTGSGATATGEAGSPTATTEATATESETPVPSLTPTP